MLSSYKNVDVVNGTVYSIPFEQKTFDSIIFADVIEHLETPDKGLSEIARVLRPSGQVYITTPQWRPDRVWDHRHVTEFTLKELSCLLNCYFSQVDFYFAWPVFFSNMYRTVWGWVSLN